MTAPVASGAGFRPDAPLVVTLERDIAAPPAAVWEGLVQVGAWPRWHRGIAFAVLRGPVAPGTSLHWQADGMRIGSILVEVEPERRLGWTIRTLGGRGYLRWTLEARPGGETRVRLEESWEGFVVRILRGTLRRTLDRSRRAWLEGLGWAVGHARAAGAPPGARKGEAQGSNTNGGEHVGDR